MKKAFFLLFFITLFQIGFSQDSDAPTVDDILKSQKSDTSKPLKIKLTGIFISAGINITQYYSDAFINYWYDKAGLATPIFNYSPESGGRVSGNFSNGSPSLCPSFSMGLQLNANDHKKLHHIIELSYIHLSCSYSGTTYYAESYSGFPANEGRSYHNIYDTVQGNYTQTILSIGYKLQPTFKSIFLSFGINCSLNLINAEEHKNEVTNGGWSNEFGYGYYPQAYTSGSANGSYKFVNFPLQLGAGGVFHVKGITLEPGFYWTYCFMKGYNIYDLSVKILYNPKKKSTTAN